MGRDYGVADHVSEIVSTYKFMIVVRNANRI